MFYIHQATCISPQQTFEDIELTVLQQPVNYKLVVKEPLYDGIPPGVLRRMSKSVRMGVGTAIPLLKNSPSPDGIIIGTANSGFEDCFHFLKQMVDYKEELLTPGSFVQSTPNALAAQLSMLRKNRGYNITHVHLGLAFENAMIDAGMLISEHPTNNYLLGAVDDISAYNYNLNFLAGWYKKEQFSLEHLYQLNTPGSIAGEGAAMFLVNGKQLGAQAAVRAVGTLHSEDELVVQQQLKYFINNNLPASEKIDLLLSGENGDSRLLKYYTSCEQVMGDEMAVARFKHISGEYPTASALAVWLACHILQKNTLPFHILRKNISGKEYKNILIYNNYEGLQHSFILVKGMPYPNP